MISTFLLDVHEHYAYCPQHSSLTDAVAGDLQSLCWGAVAVGGTLSAYYSGALLEMYTATQVFAITAIFPLIIAIASLGEL